MRTADFDYDLPQELIAQSPAERRDDSRLMVVDRQSSRIRHCRFPELAAYTRAGDLVVLNNSRVMPARLRGNNARSGGDFEILLLEENACNDWWVMLRPGKRARVGTEIRLRDLHGQPANVTARVLDTNPEGHRRLLFSGTHNIRELLGTLGEIPLPPYIIRSSPQPEDRERYQTVYAEPTGSVAAPTAGLHFTPELLQKLKDRGVQICFVTLHVGLGTFAPVKAETLTGHIMHEERFEVRAECAEAINRTKAEGGRVFAVGTTTLRVLESVAAQHGGRMVPGDGRTRIFIFPPYRFQVADALLTNFHLPRSTLLMLASAFAAPGQTGGRELLLGAYAEAVRERYRFFSYGDAMLLL